MTIPHVKGLKQEYTIVQRELTHIAYDLSFSRRSDCDKQTCMSPVENKNYCR